MYIFLKYVINVFGFLRNRSQFWVLIVIFVLNASELIRNGYYYPWSVTSVNICCAVLFVSCPNGYGVIITYEADIRRRVKFRYYYSFQNTRLRRKTSQCWPPAAGLATAEQASLRM
jgi:hypothetical protein